MKICDLLSVPALNADVYKQNVFNIKYFLHAYKEQ